MKKLFKLNIIAAAFALFATVSCGDESLTPTLEQIKDISSISSVEDLDGLLKGTLNRMTDDAYYGRDFIINDEIRGDNVFANGNSGRFQTTGNLEYVPSNGIGIWTQAYRVIANANVVINQDIASLSGDTDLGNHIKGQALFIRALAHFDLLRNYGQQHVTGGNSVGIPYLTVFKGDLAPSRKSVTEVKDAIYKDLSDAYGLMNSAYDGSSQEYPQKMAVKAIESRVALYFGDWAKAEAAAKTVISSNDYSIASAADYVSTFGQDNASNSIFELAFSDVDNQGSNSVAFIYRGDVYGDVEVIPGTDALFEDTDVRGYNGGEGVLGWEGSKLRNMGKFPNLQGHDNIAVIRYEEVILNMAEALFQQSDNAGAVSYLNMITSNRGATDYVGPVTEADILMERRKELMFEGFRFFDLSRTGNALPSVSIRQGFSEDIPYGDYRYAFPIPLVEMDANSNMTQNLKY